MAENKESVDSIRSFILEEPTTFTAQKESNSTDLAKEPRRVEITVEPDEEGVLTFVEIKPDNSKSENLFDTPAIQEALNIDVNNLSYEESLENIIRMRYLLSRTTEMLKEKRRLCQNLEKQIGTLELQTNSLKDLVFITKELLSVKTQEATNLQNEIKNMQERIGLEKEKNKHLLSNMNETVKVITKMKDEQKIQLDLISDIEEGYNKKVELLEKENKLLTSQLFAEPSSCQMKDEKVGEGDSKVPEEGTISFQ